MLIKDQDACIPEKQEIEQILKECLCQISALGAEVRAVNFTIHCRLRPSPYDKLEKVKKLTYDDSELEAPIANTVTFIIR
ncbi:hypothetical protein AAHN97_20390 [Chitinophaga niabensis]|uniref:hypothetical protein n=1 Tax=Chitinophaga niabensis TaxID=536979 RepID=UPI0031BA5C47